MAKTKNNNEYTQKKIELRDKRAVAFHHKEKVNETLRQLAFHFKVAYIGDDFTFMHYNGFWDSLQDFNTEFNDFITAYSAYQKLSEEYDMDIESDLRGFGSNDKN